MSAPKKLVVAVTGASGAPYARRLLGHGGGRPAEEALDVVRSHLGPRYLRDAATVTVQGGMIGRG